MGIKFLGHLIVKHPLPAGLVSLEGLGGRFAKGLRYSVQKINLKRILCVVKGCISPVPYDSECKDAEEGTEPIYCDFLKQEQSHLRTRVSVVRRDPVVPGFCFESAL